MWAGVITGCACKSGQEADLDIGLTSQSTGFGKTVEEKMGKAGVNFLSVPKDVAAVAHLKRRGKQKSN